MSVCLRVAPAEGSLHGQVVTPGDKSISHRALILGSLARGETRIRGLLCADDVLATAEACRQLGAGVDIGSTLTTVTGTGGAGLKAPQRPLDMGNSGTAMRLLAGVLAAQPFDSVLVGDASLSRRPMRRVVEPLRRMGARIETAEGGTAPLTIRGTAGLSGIEYSLPVASAQVKSCVLLAGLSASGTTCVFEPAGSRDHTERMLPVFGVAVGPGPCVQGGARLVAAELGVPGDISSAAFFLVAAAMVPGSDLVLHHVGINPTRDGIIRVLRAMGAELELFNHSLEGGEPVVDIRVRHARGLTGVTVPGEWVPSLIDELPALMALAAVARGTTRIRDAEELRVKESDRIAVMARGLATLGVEVEEHPDGIDIRGGRVGEGVVDGAGDHRCAMSFAILGQVASGPVVVEGASHIGTSYPQFAQHLASVGGRVRQESAEPPSVS